ncbi:type II toxin-antitoxin system RelE/ParE family toxin [Marinivivus vitaminiproducens]|uniref:type II toxin-antitoxin system RelE/ParE family toxin n=1 Tax=Marinivivus vitaminiproducens TaxID=3035935 RepID=UPI003F9FB628
MRVKWTGKALSDLTRVHDFLVTVNPQAAARIAQWLASAPARLRDHPRLGEKLDEFEPCEVRRIVIGRYEMRYEVQASAVYVLRIWRAREDR